MLFCVKWCILSHLGQSRVQTWDKAVYKLSDNAPFGTKPYTKESLEMGISTKIELFCKDF